MTKLVDRTYIESVRRIDGTPFDARMVMLSFWLVVGLAVASWATTHGLADGAITIWQLPLFAALIASAAALFQAIGHNRPMVTSWRAAIPRGYLLSLLGLFMIFVSTLGKPLWLFVFNSKPDEILVIDPMQLLLIFGMTILTSAPLCAAWAQRRTIASWIVLLSAALTLSTIASATLFISPFFKIASADTWQTTDFISNQALIASGIGGILLHTLLLMGILFMLLRRWRLPFGGVTLIITISTAFLSIQSGHYAFVPLFALIGTAGDVLVGKWQDAAQPSLSHLYQLGAMLPALLFSGYFGLVYAFDLLWWSIPLTLGTIGLAGLCGLMLAVLVFPPAVPSHVGGTR